MSHEFEEITDEEVVDFTEEALGFSMKELRKEIIKQNLIKVVIGAGLGLALGTVIGYRAGLAHEDDYESEED